MAWTSRWTLSAVDEGSWGSLGVERDRERVESVRGVRKDVGVAGGKVKAY
jgi:hypothetical protein